MKSGELETKERECPTDTPPHGKVKDHEHGHDQKVVVKVDGHPERVKPGVYFVAVFKELLGVAADRELDMLSGSIFQPLDDNAEITICGHEVFVSHVRTGGSSQ